MDKKLIFAGAFGLLFLGVLIWFLFFRKNPTTDKPIVDFSKKDDKPAATPTKTVTNVVYVNGGGGGNARNDNFPLKQGSYGDKVKLIQAKLKLAADGDWGLGTQAALTKVGITNGFSDQATLDKWLGVVADTNSGATALATMSGGQLRDKTYTGKWANNEPVSVYEDAYPTAKVVNGFNAMSSFFGLGVVKNGFLLVQYGGRLRATRGWVLLSKLTQTEKAGLFDPFDEENEKNSRKRKPRKKY